MTRAHPMLPLRRGAVYGRFSALSVSIWAGRGPGTAARDARRHRDAGVNRQPPHLVEQRAQADAEQRGGLPAVATGRLERAQDRLALDRLDLGLEVETGVRGGVAMAVPLPLPFPLPPATPKSFTSSGPSPARAAARSTAFRSSRTLPGQRVVAERGERARRDAHRMAEAVRRLAGEMGEQRRNVLRPLAKRRQVDPDGVEPLEQVGAELARSTASSSDLDEAATRRTSTGAASRPPVRDTLPSSSTRTSLACSSGGRAPISSRKSVPSCASSKSPAWSAVAPGMRAGDVPEELGLEQLRGHGAAVDAR